MAWIEKLVGRSPIGPMQEHMRASVTCAREILPLIEAMAAGDDQAIQQCRADIDRLEHEADTIKNEITTLNKLAHKTLRPTWQGSG